MHRLLGLCVRRSYSPRCFFVVRTTEVTQLESSLCMHQKSQVHAIRCDHNERNTHGETREDTSTFKIVECKNSIRVRIRLFPHCALEKCKVQNLAYRIKRKNSPFQARLALTSSCVFRKEIDWIKSQFDDKKMKEMVVERRAPPLRSDTSCSHARWVRLLVECDKRRLHSCA
jgi:hypothetical protein